MLTIEIINQKTKNIIVSTCYRPPASKIKPFKKHLKSFFDKTKCHNKKMFIVGDFNINSLDYTKNTVVKNFINLMFQNGTIPVINKPTRVTNKSTTCIDHIYINSFYNQDISSGIIKTDISDHLPVFIIHNDIKLSSFPNKIKKQIRLINSTQILAFKTELGKINWAHITSCQSSNDAYDLFLEKFITLYNTHFPIKTIEIKTKSLFSPWITNGLLKSSKQKQKLYIKYLKNRTFLNETNYKNYKNLFERIKLKSKQNHFSLLLIKYQNNAKKTWETIKTAIGKTKLKSSNFPRKMLINNTDFFDEDIIATSFNNYFVNVGPDLSKNIPKEAKCFTEYLNQSDKNKNILLETELTLNEFKKAFGSLKSNKANGYDDINSNIVKSSYDELFIPLFHICRTSLLTGSVPDSMKIAKITPLFKSGDTDKLNNYRPISVLPVFSKLLERIMYNRVYSHLINHQLLYERQFGFQQNCSTEHAILQLTKEIYESFDENKFTLGVFIDLSKAFDTVNHKILLKKLTYFGIKGVYLDWFNSYLRNRKQFIFYNDKNSSMLDITCGVPQGSILGPLLFLLYINDLQKASSIIKPIMFADDTNIFFSDKHITSLFSTMNNELKNIQKWFNSNKLSLNASKTKYIFFHSQAHSGDIPLKLPKLEINTTTIVRESVIKFLGVLLDENISWKTHISTIENKISKNLGILYKARLVLNQKSIKQLYFSFIHSYLNYGNMAWGSTNKTKLNQLLRHQNFTGCAIVFCK